MTSTSSEHPSPTVPPAKVALVTGASRGIGKAIAQVLAHRGLSVGLLARSNERLEAVAAELRSRGGHVETVTADVTDAGAVTKAVAHVENTLGPIDLLVNNAGVVDPEVPLWQAKPEDFKAVLETNVYGAFLLARAVTPGIVERRGGRVVDVNSGAGTRDFATMPGYNAAKTALFRIGGGIHAAGYELGLRAFEVAPGVVATDMATGMDMHQGRTEWNDAGEIGEIIAAIATGNLDALSGCYLRAGQDEVAALRERAQGGQPAGRRLVVTDWEG